MSDDTPKPPGRRGSFDAGHGKPIFHADPLTFTREQLDHLLASKEIRGRHFINRAIADGIREKHGGTVRDDQYHWWNYGDTWTPSEAVSIPFARTVSDRESNFDERKVAKSIFDDEYVWDDENGEPDDTVWEAGALRSYGNTLQDTDALDFYYEQDGPAGRDSWLGSAHAGDFVSSLAAEGKFAGAVQYDSPHPVSARGTRKTAALVNIVPAHGESAEDREPVPHVVSFEEDGRSSVIPLHEFGPSIRMFRTPEKMRDIWGAMRSEALKSGLEGRVR